MPLFGGTPFDQDVDKVTNEANTTEDWALILDMCDKVKSNPNAPKDVIKSVMRRLKTPNPHVQLQSLVLLGALVSNCGKPFHHEICTRDSCADFRNIISKGHPKVSEKMRQLIKDWADKEMKGDPQCSLISQLYNSLKTEGYSFSSSDTPSKSTPQTFSNDPNVVSSQQEEDDIAKAIALSLQEPSGKSSSGGGGGGGGGSSSGGGMMQSTGLYPTTNSLYSMPVQSEPRKVKALYDFEAAEDNELTFKAGEIISVLDDRDVNWWKGENFRGVGLFPSNFVTADLTAETEPEIKAREKKVSFDEEVEVRTIEAAQPSEVTINAETMDQCLDLLQNADPTMERPDQPEMPVLEATCNHMAPLIDQELEGIDRDHAELTALNQRLLNAFQMYHDLMKEAPVYGYSLKGAPIPGGFPPGAVGPVPVPGAGPIPVPGSYGAPPMNMGMVPPQQMGQFNAAPPQQQQYMGPAGVPTTGPVGQPPMMQQQQGMNMPPSSQTVPASTMGMNQPIPSQAGVGQPAQSIYSSASPASTTMYTGHPSQQAQNSLPSTTPAPMHYNSTGAPPHNAMAPMGTVAPTTVTSYSQPLMAMQPPPGQAPQGYGMSPPPDQGMMGHPRPPQEQLLL